MDSKIDVDARGLACPQPVVKTKQALEAIGEGAITVLIERPEGRENVTRFARSQGCNVNVTEEDGLYYIRIEKTRNTPAASGNEAAAVIVVASDRLGSGNDKLGKVLMRAFITTLNDADTRPEKILFINSGVKLTTGGSPVLDDLAALAGTGVAIFSCGTCLDYYSLKDKLKVGQVTNMYDTVASLLAAAKIIRI